MAKRKDGKVLFEVLRPTGPGGEEKSLGVPGWFGQPPTSKAPPPGVAAPAAPAASPPVRPVRVRTVAAAGADRAGPPTQPAASPPERLLWVQEGRVLLSLNGVSAAVVAMVAALIVLAAFALGRRSGLVAPPPAPPAQGAPDGVEEAAPQEPQAGGGAVVVPVTLAPDDAPRERGKVYYIIEGGIRTYDEAKAIKLFLASRNCAATMHPYTRGGTQYYMIKGLAGFASDGDPAARLYKQSLLDLGKRYKEAGGPYDFRAPFPVTEQ